MNDRKKEFDDLCGRNASDFEFAWNGFVRIYEDRKKETTALDAQIEYCEKCKNEKVACVCMDNKNELD